MTRAAGFALILLLCAASALASNPLAWLTLETEAGYDDNILADPEGLGVIRPTSASLLELSPSLHLRRAGVRSRISRDRLEATLTETISGYSMGGVGPDQDLRGSVLYQTEVGGAFQIEGSASFHRFRRRSLPVFDLDLPEGAIRVARVLDGRWLAAVDLVYARPSYPGRLLGESDHQLDRRAEIAASLLRTFGANGYAAFRSRWRSVDSNDPLAVQDGPVFEIDAGGALRKGSAGAMSIAFSQRSYRDYPVLIRTPQDTIATGDSRRDRIVQVALSAEQPFHGTMSAFGEILWTHEGSNIDALRFGQTSVHAGVRVTLWRAGSSNESASRSAPPNEEGSPNEMAPVIRPDGVLFRVMAPGAGRVALVGGFNGWDPARDLLRGPDAEGRWETVLPLPAGTWRYAFLVDGRWVRPEGAARYEDDGFGGQNGVLDLETPVGYGKGP